jgi:hypothetical protein
MNIFLLGRSLYISKSLNQENREIFQSRKVHFGLLGKFKIRFK